MLNDAMFSIVEDRDDSDLLLVRARRKGDIEMVFSVTNVVESDDSDYRFRIWLSRHDVKKVMANEIDRIDYDNFKNSVEDEELHDAYTKVWGVFYRIQLRKYPRKEPVYADWSEYLEQRYGQFKYY